MPYPLRTLINSKIRDVQPGLSKNSCPLPAWTDGEFNDGGGTPRAQPPQATRESARKVRV